PDGDGIGDVGEARRRRNSGDYAEESQRSPRRRDQARWYQFIEYTPLGSLTGTLSDSDREQGMQRQDLRGVGSRAAGWLAS
ncbi:MAG TPA: hypothetical protein VNM92_11035, partial [Thermoanaerobaculia bacterium]|nr:hypothetical protein [Thermoanaerobaculia bacterium]